MIKIDSEIYKNIKYDYLNGMSLKRLENKYNISCSVLFNRLKKDKTIPIDRKVVVYNDFEKEPYTTIKNMYINEKLSMMEISKLTDIQIGTIQYYLKKFNLTRNNETSKQLRSEQNLTNSDFFNFIDNEEKAYWLGFIMADGNISKNEYQLKIHLNIQDKDHLEKFANIFDKKVKEFSRIDSRNNKEYYGVKIEISNKYLINGLLKHGVTSKKSYTLDNNTFNNISNELKRHFIRGYFDGDGSTNGRCISFVSCSKEFLINVGDYINEVLCIKDYTIYEHDAYSVVVWYKKENINKIKDYFYKDSTIYLQRKLDKILKVQNNTNQKNVWKDEEMLLLKKLTKEDFKNKDNVVNLFTDRTFDGIYRKYRRLN